MSYNKEDRQWLHGRLQSKGYDVGSYDEFEKSLQNKDDADWYYKKATDMGLEVGSRDEFDSLFVRDMHTEPSEDDAIFEANAERFRNGQPTEKVTTQSVIDASPELSTKQVRDGVLPTLEEQVHPKGFGKPGFMQDEASALHPMSNTSLVDRLSSPRILDENNNIRAAKEAEEEKEIDKTFVSKPMNTAKDVYENYSARFTNTQRGIELGEEMAAVTKKVQDKYIKEYMESDAYKNLASKYDGDESVKKANEQFAFLYGEAINEELKPYQKAYNDELNLRYGSQMDKELYRISKEEAGRNLKQLSSSVNSELDEIEKKIAARKKAVRNDNWKPGMPSSRDDRELAALRGERTYLEGAQELTEDSQKILNAVEAEKDGNFFGGLGRGVRDTAVDIDTWTMGLSDLVGGLRLNKILDKAERGEKLTTAEERLLDASVNNMAINFYYRGDLGMGYQAGEITGQSIPFMLEFIVNPISASGNAMAKKLLTWGLKRYGSVATKKGVKAATRFATDAIAAGGVTGTTGLGNVMSGTVERLNRDYEYGLDNEGNLQITKNDEVNFGSALAKSATSAFLERQSEMIFNAFRGAKPLFEGVNVALPGGVNTFMNYVSNSRLGELWKGIRKNEAMRELAKRAQIHSLGEEYLEEVYNNFANIPLGEMTFEEATDLQQNLVTFLGLAPTQVVLGAYGGVRYGLERYKTYRDMKRAFGNLSDEQRKKLEELQAMGKLKENKDIAFFLAETIKDESLTPEQKRAEIEYAYNLAKQNAIDEISESETEEVVSEENAAIDAATDPQTGLYGEVNLVSQDLDGNDVVTPANVFGEKEVNGELYLLVQVEGETEKKWVRPNEYDAASYLKMPSEEVKVANEQIIREEAAQQAEREAKYAPEVLEQQMSLGTPFETDEAIYVPISQSPEGNGFIVEVQPKNVDNKTASQPYTMEMTNDQFHDVLQTQYEATQAQQAEAEQAQASTQSIVEGMEAKPMNDGTGRVMQPKGLDGEKVVYDITDKEGNVLEEGSMDAAKYNEVEEQKAEEETQQPIAENVGTENIGQEPKQAEIKPEKPVIPTKKDGSVDFVTYGKEGTFKTLGEKYGEKMPNKIAVTAKALADDLAKAQKKLAKAEEAYDNAPIGREQKAEEARDKARQELEDVKREADFWAELDNEVKEAQFRRESILNPQAEVETSTEPMTADEFVAQQLAAGNIVLNKEDYMKETGFGNEEANAMNGGTSKLFKKDGMTIQEAGERLMEMDREAGTNFFDQSDPNAGRDTIISLLGSVKSRKELNAYIANNRAEQAQRESEGLRNELEKQVMDANYASLEDYVAQIEAAEVEENPFRDVDVAQIDAIFVEAEEEYQNYINNEQGRTSEVVEGNDNVLSEEQSDNTGGTSGIESEGNAEGNGDGVAQESEGSHDATEVVKQEEGETTLQFAERAAEENRRRPLRKRAKEWSKALGVEVIFLESVDQIPDARTRRRVEAYHKEGSLTPGWFTQSNGKVYFLMSDLADLAEVDNTYIHEVVAHKGISEMLGKERFNQLCDKVWEMMSAKNKTFYADYVGTEEFTRKDGSVDIVAQHRAAADEYIAHLAEAQNLTPEETTIWDNIVKAFRELLDKALNGIISKSRLTDEDVANIIRASYANLKNGATEGAVGEGTRFNAKKGNIAVSAEEYAKIAHQIATYPQKADRGHVFTDNNYYLCTDIDDEGNFRIVASLKIEGNEELINSLRGKDGQRNFKAIEGTESLTSIVEEVKRRGGRTNWNIPSSKRQSRTDGRNDSVHLGKQSKSGRNQQSPNKDDGKANFRIVFHGSGASFDKFDHSFMGTGEGAQAYGWGTYVTEVDGIARSYGNKMRTSVIKYKGNIVSLYEKIPSAVRSVVNLMNISDYSPEDAIKYYIDHYQRDIDFYESRVNEQKDKIGLIQQGINILNGITDEEFNSLKKEYQFGKLTNGLQDKERDYLAYIWGDGFYNMAKAINKSIDFIESISSELEETRDKQKDAESKLAQYKELKASDFELKRSKAHLYVVDIPDNDGTNYLEWDRPLSEMQINTMFDRIVEDDVFVEYEKIYGTKNAKYRLDKWLRIGSFGDVYKSLKSLIFNNSSSDSVFAKGVSQMLSRIGYTGIEYPAQYTTGGRADGAKNYVIFNEHDLDIVEHTRFRKVTDKKLIDKLESEPKIKVYRAMQLLDGKLYPPMSAKVDGKMREPIELGKWEMAEERPDLADDKGYFKLDKGNKTSLKARYNPYIHTSTTPLNDQFSSAQTRPELVTVEVEIPESELTSGYKAERAKDAVGKMEWKAGVVQGKLSGTRTVILSRYDKPIRIVPDSEVAAEIVKMFDGRDITMPSNVVTPSLRAELEKLGVPFVETDNKGREVGNRFRITPEHKKKQLGIIQETNPAPNDVNTWIRTEEDILSFEEALDSPDYADYEGEDFDPSYTWDMVEDALKSGKIIVYSSYPIKNGVFVTPSYMEAESYGGSTPYMAKVNLEDVAWIDPTQGQLATEKKVTYKKASTTRFRLTKEEQESLRDSEESKALFDYSKKRFGKTLDLREAGYILPDGTMLDFSGRHEMSPGSDTSFLRGQRSVDHRYVQDLNYTPEDEGGEKTGFNTDMADFINRGAIRMDGNSGGINLTMKPTSKQKSILRRLIDRMGGDVYVDFSNGWNNEHYAEYESAKPLRVLSDIDKYYDEGLKPTGNIRFRISNQNQAIFVSNAAKAVEGIKQEKGTPQQWLAMIEKNGGLKAGEDKWLGLSDWLKGLDKKSVTKDEILDYINENKIQIEEVHYEEGGEIDALRDEYPNFDEAFVLDDDFGGLSISIYNDANAVDIYNQANPNNTIELATNSRGEKFLLIDDEDTIIDWVRSKIEEIKPINSTRLDYTTAGLKNNHEIALVVPTIEPYNQNDKIHFGDAGEGRAVAWIRFGETRDEDAEMEKAVAEANKAANDFRKKMYEKYTPGSKDSSEFWDYISEEDAAVLIGLYEAEDLATIRAEKAKKRVLVIDEIQSKRHQDGREKGYKKSEKQIRKEHPELNYWLSKMEEAESHLNDLKSQLGDRFLFDSEWTEEETEQWAYWRNQYGYADAGRGDYLLNVAPELNTANQNSIPDAPFDKNWHELAMKRMLRYAAENGFDKVAWTTGAQQAERYNLGSVVNSIESRDYEEKDSRSHNGSNKEVTLYMNHGETALYVDKQNGEIYDAEGQGLGVEVIGKNLSEIVGKELAVKLLGDGDIFLSGDGLSIGGEGMKGFYDKMLPSFVQKYTKKWGAKVGMIELPEVDQTMHYVDVTDAMKESVMEGQTMFRLSPKGKQLQAEVDKFTSKYNSKPVTLIESEMTDEELDGIIPGWTAKDVKFVIKENWVGGYSKDTDEIYIFVDNMDNIEDTLFHENTHEFLKENPEIVQEFYANAAHLLPELRAKLVRLKYKEHEIPEEMFVRVSTAGVLRGELYNVLHYLSDANAEKYVELLNNFGYVWKEEANSRVLEKYGQLSSSASGKERRTGESVQDDASREDRELLEETKRERRARLEDLFTRVADMGLQGVLGNKEYDRMMMDIYSVLPEDARKEVASETLKHYGTNFVPAVSDYIGAKADGSIWDKIVSIVREALRKVGFNLDLNTNEVKYLAWRSKKPLDRNNLLDMAEDIDMKHRLGIGEYDGTTPDGGGTKFKVVYHGSGASFDKFDHSFMGTGEGNQSFGWGTYVTDVKGIGEKYANIYANNSPLAANALRWIQENETYEDFITKGEGKRRNYAIRSSRTFLKEMREDGASEEVIEAYESDLKDAEESISEEAYNRSKKYMIDSLNRNLYTVEIPDNDGTNYIAWEKMLPKEQAERIKKAVRESDYFKAYEKEYGRLAEERLDAWTKTSGGRVYKNLGNFTFLDNGADKAISQLLSKAGFVGFEYPANFFSGGNDFGHKNYVIFNENDLEIKEHTRFRVSNKLQVRDEYEAIIKKGGYQAREAVQDAMLSLRKFQELIEKASGKKIRDFENAWMHENRLSSVVQAEIHEMERKFYKPMMDAVKTLMERADMSEYEVADYLMLKHGIERNREMAVRKALMDDKGKIDRRTLETWYNEKQNIRNDASLDTWRKKQEAMDALALQFGADMSRDYSGLTSMFDTDDIEECTNRAYDEVEALENAHPGETRRLCEAIKDMTQNTLDKSFESGLMDRKVYEELKNDMYDYYIPLRGFEETTSEEVYAYLDQDRGAFNAPLKRAHGRSSKADNPIAYLKSIAESGIMQGNRNKMKQSFLNMVLNNPSDLVSVREGVWVMYNSATGEWEAASLPHIPNNATPADVEAAMEAWEQQMEQAAQNNPNMVKKVSEAADIPYRVVGNKLNQHQVIVKRLGKSYTLTINGNPRLAMALNGLTNPNNTSNDGKVTAYVSGKIDALNRTLSAWYTTRNPDFVASNFMRDTFYTNTIVRAKEGNKYANKFHANYAKLLMPGRMINLFRKYENGTLDASDKMEAAFLDFMMNGGETGYSNLKDLEQIKKQISKELKGSRLAKVEKAAEKLDILNRAVENTARFAAFLTSREEGRSIAKSVFDAKEISVNFNKKGAGGTFFGMTGQTGLGNMAAMVGAGGRALYVFFNAAIQGTTNLMHVMKVNPKGTSAGIAAMFLMGAVVPMLFAGDDDEKDYYDLPEHVRRNHLIIPGTGDAWISIPLPIEYRIMYGMGELLTSWRTGHERGENIAKKMLNLTGQALPLNFLEEGMDAFIPSALSPLWQVYNNRSWTGLPIYKDTEFNKDDPEYTKAYKNVDKLLYNFSKSMYEWTFDEENQKEGIDLNPAVMESLARGYFGGLATQLSNIGKTAEIIAGEREFDWRSIPVANRLFKSGDERTKEKRITNEYFDNMEKLDFLQSRERRLKKIINGPAVPQSDKDKADDDYKVMKGTEIYQKYQDFKVKKKEVDKIRKQIKAKGSTEELEKKLSKAQEEANKVLR